MINTIKSAGLITSMFLSLPALANYIPSINFDYQGSFSYDTDDYKKGTITAGFTSPLYQNKNNLFFSDVRASHNYFLGNSFKGGHLGAGLRHKIGNVTVGVNGFYDTYNDDDSSHQYVLGMELLNPNVEFKGNFFFPKDSKQLSNGGEAELTLKIKKVFLGVKHYYIYNDTADYKLSGLGTNIRHDGTTKSKLVNYYIQAGYNYDEENLHQFSVNAGLSMSFGSTKKTRENTEFVRPVSRYMNLYGYGSTGYYAVTSQTSLVNVINSTPKNGVIVIKEDKITLDDTVILKEGQQIYGKGYVNSTKYDESVRTVIEASDSSKPLFNVTNNNILIGLELVDNLGATSNVNHVGLIEAPKTINNLTIKDSKITTTSNNISPILFKDIAYDVTIKNSDLMSTNIANTDDIGVIHFAETVSSFAIENSNISKNGPDIRGIFFGNTAHNITIDNTTLANSSVANTKHIGMIEGVGAINSFAFKNSSITTNSDWISSILFKDNANKVTIANADLSYTNHTNTHGIGIIHTEAALDDFVIDGSTIIIDAPNIRGFLANSTADNLTITNSNISDTINAAHTNSIAFALVEFNNSVNRLTVESSEITLNSNNNSTALKLNGTANHVTINNSVLVHSTDDGKGHIIHFAGDSDYIEIKGSNIISDNLYSNAVHFSSKSDNITIQNNTFSVLDSASDALYLSGDAANINITGNTFIGDSLTFNSSITDVTISSNIFKQHPDAANGNQSDITFISTSNSNDITTTNLEISYNTFELTNAYDQAPRVIAINTGPGTHNNIVIKNNEFTLDSTATRAIFTNNSNTLDTTYILDNIFNVNGEGVTLIDTSTALGLTMTFADNIINITTTDETTYSDSVFYFASGGLLLQGSQESTGNTITVNNNAAAGTEMNEEELVCGTRMMPSPGSNASITFDVTEIDSTGNKTVKTVTCERDDE